jgi:hypothetical protein
MMNSLSSFPPAFAYLATGQDEGQIARRVRSKKTSLDGCKRPQDCHCYHSPRMQRHPPSRINATAALAEISFFSDVSLPSSTGDP